MQDKLQDALECKICLVQYDDVAKKPLNLKCGHTFCKGCLADYLTSKQGQMQCMYSCPLSKETLASVDVLPVNYSLIALLGLKIN